MIQGHSFQDLSIIFHHPGPIVSNGTSGSQVRPFQILKAFKTLGVNVDLVAGSQSERRRAINRIKQAVREGKHYDFVYCENRTIPFAMTESHRLPTHPFLDHLFLDFCHRQRIPVSLYYRDIFWRFPAYKSMLPWVGRLVTIPLYWYDWLFHQRYVHTLYLPSLGMRHSLPSTKGMNRIADLPPGSAAHLVKKVSADSKEALSLLYVGGVEPPTYDLRPILNAVNQTSCRLTVCCREAEWERFSHFYQTLISHRTEIVHLAGDELKQLYERSDLMIMLRNPNPYLDFAVPVKIFESIGYETPIMTTGNSEAGRIVHESGLGWVTSLIEAPNLLTRLAKDRTELQGITNKLRERKCLHTWEARAAQICREMSDISINMGPF